jgi:hypothetical protein
LTIRLAGSTVHTVMANVTIISDDVRTVEATTADGRLLVDPDRLEEAVGWRLKPEGLCQDDTCVPVRDAAALYVGDQLDLSAVAAALSRPAVVDAKAGIAAIALAAERRQGAVDRLQAPTFCLPDLDGAIHSLDEWRGSKKLLVAFASW